MRASLRASRHAAPAVSGGLSGLNNAPGSYPDPVTTGQEAFEEAKRHARGTVPLGRVGDVREVGFLALYMVSDASDYMTGETVYLDGGASFA